MRAQFFGLQFGDNGINVRQGDSVDDIGAIASLDEELSQSDRYIETEVSVRPCRRLRKAP